MTPWFRRSWKLIWDLISVLQSPNLSIKSDMEPARDITKIDFTVIFPGSSSRFLFSGVGIAEISILAEFTNHLQMHSHRPCDEWMGGIIGIKICEWAIVESKPSQSGWGVGSAVGHRSVGWDSVPIFCRTVGTMACITYPYPLLLLR